MLQSDDQGLLNTDPRTIAVPDTFINNIPTDIRGLTFSRTPQQLINMYSLGNPDGVGPFFPNGLVGAINRPTGYMNMASGLEDFPSEPYLATQVQHLTTLSPVLLFIDACCSAGFAFLFNHALDHSLDDFDVIPVN